MNRFVLCAVVSACFIANEASASACPQGVAPTSYSVVEGAQNVAAGCWNYVNSSRLFNGFDPVANFIQDCNGAANSQYSFIRMGSNTWDFYSGTTYQFTASISVGGGTACPHGYNLAIDGLCYSANPDSNVCPGDDDRLDPAPPDREKEYCPVKNPIDQADGNKFQTELDYQASGPYPLSYTRYYNKDNPRLSSSIYGAQWLSNYGRAILPDPYPASLTTVRALRAHGGLVHYQLVNGAWVSPTGRTESLESVPGGGWKLYNDDDELETYDTAGRLTSIARRDGLAHTLSYDPSSGRLTTVTDSFQHTLTFTYDANGRVATMVNPAGAATGTYVFTYSGGRLSTVTYPDTTFKTYHYEDSAYPNALTGITDEKNKRFATYSYYADGRGKITQHAGGADYALLTYDDANGETDVTDGLGATRTYKFTTKLGRLLLDSVTQPGCGSCSTSAQRTYDANGNLETSEDFNGNVTTYLFNTRGLEESRTEAYGNVVLARTTTTAWHTLVRKPTVITEPGRRTTNAYDAVTGQLTSRTVTDLITAQEAATGEQLVEESRQTIYIYDPATKLLDKIDGARPDSDVVDVANFDFDTSGNLIRITNAIGQATEIPDHDAHGNPTRIVDPNGVATTLTYDLRQRLKTRTVDGAQTKFDYDNAGLLDKVTLPDNSYLDYEYDDAHRLTDIRDNVGNHIHYMLDAEGNRTNEEVRDPGNALKRAQSWVFNSLGQLDLVKNAAGEVTVDYGYDDQGNRTSQLDYRTSTTGHTTAYLPDELNRIKSVTPPGSNGVTEYGYNPLDQITSIKDAKGLTTEYRVNAFGNLKRLNSPDTGITNYPAYDAAGNRKQQVDARGVQVDYTYDALNRLTFINYPDTAEDVTYTYDSTLVSYGKGRLTGIVDQSGVTTLSYDARGNVKDELRVIGGTNYLTHYDYDPADRVIGITYPTGRTVTYGRNSIGQVTSVTSAIAGVTTTVASSITYEPFGGIKSYVLGNGVTVTRSHDLDGRIDEVKDQGTALLQDVKFHYDLQNNIEATENLVNVARSQTFGYDELSRLASAEGLYGIRGFTYDAVGNRLTHAMTPLGGSATTDVYTYPASSHRLDTISNGTTFSYNNAGNVTSNGTLTFAYNSANRAGSIGSVANTYNAIGQRVVKTAAGTTTLFHYDRKGHLLAETGTAGQLALREYVWLEDLPLSLDSPTASSDTVVDNSSAGFSVTGNWATSSATSGYYGADYRIRTAGTLNGTVILDNGEPGTSKSQSSSWQVQTTPSGYYGSNYERAGPAGATYTWSLAVPTPGDYKVYARWVASPTHSHNLRYTVTYTGGSFTYQPIDQTMNGGTWNLLGTHPFTATAQMQLNGGGGDKVADAVKIVPVISEYARWAVPAAQTYEVYARWPADAAHSTQAVYRVVHATGTTTVVKNQQTNGGNWNLLGSFTFSNPATQGVQLLGDADATVVADAVRYRSAGTNSSYYHLDHLGTPQKLTNAGQAVVWDASYQPFGQTTLLVNTITQPLRFPGQYFDAETGLHQNWHRDYDPALGRYLQSDPIGLAGGLSTYAYSGSNPVNFVDPTGLDRCFLPRWWERFKADNAAIPGIAALPGLGLATAGTVGQAIGQPTLLNAAVDSILIDYTGLPGAANWAGALETTATNVAVVGLGFEIGVGIGAMLQVGYENTQSDPIRFVKPDGTTGTYDPAAGGSRGCGCE
jgi:RHS repeat-associated protein